MTHPVEMSQQTGDQQETAVRSRERLIAEMIAARCGTCVTVDLADQLAADIDRELKRATPPAAPVITAFGEDDHGWNIDTTGHIGIGLFGDAVQVYALAQPGDVSVAQAAAFNVAPKLIIDAVEFHGWMYLSGPHDDYSKLLIEHDGE